jgi:hypothetical protein
MTEAEYIGSIFVEGENDRPVEIAETRTYQKDADSLLTDDERSAIQMFVALNPEAGDLIQGTGGVRKLRWGRQNKGKSGGARIVYFYHDPEMPIFLIALYAKSERDNLPQSEKNLLKLFVRELVESYKKGMRSD